MKRNYLLVMAVAAIFTLISVQAFASDEPWSDYDPCGWNVEQEVLESEVAVVDEPWSDYDPCGWNVEQEEVKIEVAKASVTDAKQVDYVN